MTLLGYEFRNERLAEEALTTPACKMDRPRAKDNQRLEFLGDSVLGMMAAERLCEEFPNEQEGPLTVRRTHMVSTAALSAAATRLGLGAMLKRNRGADPLPRQSKTLADAVEAVIGAAYLDGGFAAARQVFAALELDVNALATEWSENPKGLLQVRAQAMLPPRHPVYELLSTSGKAHAPTFTVRVTVEGLGTATASASTRREAEARAAAQLVGQSPRQ